MDYLNDVCMEEVKKIWLSTPDSFPDFMLELPDETRAQNEQYFRGTSEAFAKKCSCFPLHAWGRKTWKNDMWDMLKRVLSEETVIGLHEAMDQRSANACVDELRDFLRHVRAFAPELPMDGIGQAIRNYIVYAMFNEINNTGSGFCMATFGYSMLYPFTDNFIDSPHHSDHEKKVYNQLIRD